MGRDLMLILTSRQEIENLSNTFCHGLEPTTPAFDKAGVVVEIHNRMELMANYGF